MNLQLTRIYAVLVGALAVIGIFTGDRIFDLMNSDVAIDLIRVILAAYLIYAGFVSRTPSAINGVLLLTGLVYVGAGILGLLDSELWGLLPSGLTGFDIGFHLLTGIIALIAGARKSEEVKTSVQDTINV